MALATKGLEFGKGKPVAKIEGKMSYAKKRHQISKRNIIKSLQDKADWPSRVAVDI